MKMLWILVTVLLAQSCTIDDAGIQKSLKAFEDKGYKVEHGRMTFLSNNTRIFGANPSSVYGVCFEFS